MSRATPPVTSRLDFRTWRPDDVEDAMTLWADPRVTALIDAREALDRTAVEERLRAEIDLQARHGVQYWPVFLRSTGELAGCCGLHPREPGLRIWELGFHLCPKFWGLGLATEAAGAVVRFAFETLAVAALFAGHHPDNAASRRVLEKLGFRYTHHELFPPTGLRHPSYCLARTDSAGPAA